MTPDVLSLYKFYETALGKAVAAALSKNIAGLWHDGGDIFLGVGYVPPLFERLTIKTTADFSLMPVRQGVMQWPKGRNTQSLLVENDLLPFPDNSADKVILLHALEHSKEPERLLREVWRVLKPEGRVIVIVPNRRRIWASIETTPFGHGRPYSMKQLTSLLEDKLLTPTVEKTALFMPPSQSLGIPNLLGPSEWITHQWARASGGVLLVEATKKIFGGIPESTKERAVNPAVAGSR